MWLLKVVGQDAEGQEVSGDLGECVSTWNCAVELATVLLSPLHGVPWFVCCSLHHSPLPKLRHWKYLKEFCGILLQRSELCGLVCVVFCSSPSEWVSACCRNCTVSFGLFQALFERHTVRRCGTRVRPLAGCQCTYVHDYVHMCGGLTMCICAVAGPSSSLHRPGPGG